VLSDGDDDVSIALDEKVKTVTPIHARLPDATLLIVFLGVKRGVVEILKQKAELLVNQLLYLLGETLVIISRPPCAKQLHAYLFQRCLKLLNGVKRPLDSAFGIIS
jgi:hypothetical protein